MGLYDNIKCEYPLPGKFPAELQTVWFQTKDLGSSLSDHIITSDGKLCQYRYKLIYNTKKSSVKFGNKKINLPSIKERKFLGHQELVYDGAVTFYTNFPQSLDYPSKAEKWYEYCAFFENGKLIKIIQVKYPCPQIKKKAKKKAKK